MKSPQERSAWLGLGMLLCLGSFAWMPAFYPGYWQGLEGFVPLFAVTHPTPLATIATTPDFWRGAGAESFLLTRLLLQVGVMPLVALRLSFVITLLAGGIGIYAWLRARLGDRAAGLAGLIYMLLPTVLSTVYIRGSLSDAMILGLLPVAFAGTSHFAARRSWAALAVTVVTLLWLWRAQAGLALLSTLLLVIHAAVVEQQLAGVLLTLLSGVAGWLSVLPRWGITAPAPVAFGEHFVYLFQLFNGSWQVAPSVPGWQDHYPFQLGFAALVLGMVAIWLWWRGGSEALTLGQNRLLGFCSIGALIICLLVLSPSALLWQASGAQRLLTWPWQVLLLAAPLFAALAGYAGWRMTRRRVVLP